MTGLFDHDLVVCAAPIASGPEMPSTIFGVASISDGMIRYIDITDDDAETAVKRLIVTHGHPVAKWAAVELAAGSEVFPHVLKNDAKASDLAAYLLHYRRMGYRLLNDCRDHAGGQEPGRQHSAETKRKISKSVRQNWRRRRRSSDMTDAPSHHCHPCDEHKVLKPRF